jgi:lipoyl(octanoyl) transferase
LPLLVRRRGLSDYAETCAEMRRLTEARGADSADELWLLEHPPVFTLGQAGLSEHVLAAGEIPLIRTDRGGQVTYHGPGQVVGYLLFDLKRARLGVKQLVGLLEQAVVEVLGAYGIDGRTRADAPGVYIAEAKVASVGLRVRHACSYHGIALNVDLDLEPFGRINPCGYPGLEVTRLCDHGVGDGCDQVAGRLAETLARLLGRRPVAAAPQR